MYKRINVYPNGTPIPESLPDSYQSSVYGNTPAGQRCLTCKNFNLGTRYCTAWDAPVKPYWWCDGWTPITLVAKNSTSSTLLKKITTNTVEEHFSETLNLKSKLPGYNFNNNYENKEDVIKLNVPLMIRLLEWANEDACKDVNLHIIAENLIELSEYGNTLTMSEYPEIVRDIEIEKKENKS